MKLAFSRFESLVMLLMPEKAGQGMDVGTPLYRYQWALPPATDTGELSVVVSIRH